jgi:hypothetical protein
MNRFQSRKIPGHSLVNLLFFFSSVFFLIAPGTLFGATEIFKERF